MQDAKGSLLTCRLYVLGLPWATKFGASVRRPKYEVSANNNSSETTPIAIVGTFDLQLTRIPESSKRYW